MFRDITAKISGHIGYSSRVIQPLQSTRRMGTSRLSARW